MGAIGLRRSCWAGRLGVLARDARRRAGFVASPSSSSLLAWDARRRASSISRAVSAASLRESADRMLDFYLQKQRPDGSLAGLDDACHYCKMPNALIWGGRIPEADAMLDFCVSRFLRPNGDFTTRPTPNHFAPAQDKTLHWEFYDFYAYLNQWWITAGIRLSRFDFVGKAFDYVEANWYNAKAAAGILQAPIDGRYENCIFTSAHLGFTFLHMGRREHALALGDTIVAMVEKQPHLDDERLTYYNRFDDEYNLLRGFKADDRGVKLAAIVNGKEPGQCWWSLGYPVAFLAHLYSHSRDPRYLATAERILDFVRRCHPDARANIVAHKVMWGAGLVGSLTGDPKHWELMRAIAGHIMQHGQAEDGRMTNWAWERGTAYGEAQVVDQTCEIAYWFYVTARQMEKAELAGRLA